MVNNRRHLSFVILDEGQLRAIDLEEEIRFRLRINLNHTLKDVLAQGLTEQPVSFPPDRHFSFPWEARWRSTEIRSGRRWHPEVLCPA